MVKKKGIFFLIIILIGIAYCIFVNLTGVGIPCVFRKVTGYKCPGCGVTSMCTNITKLHFKEAMESNPFLFFTMPFIIAEIIIDTFVSDRKFRKVNSIILIMYIIALLVFGVCRNM